MTPLPLIDLRPGYRITRVIRGGWQLAGGHGPVDRAEAVADMMAFAEAGILTFDCADIYTGVEELIGAFRTAWADLPRPGRSGRPACPHQAGARPGPDAGHLRPRLCHAASSTPR
jgi:hypothetical protein